MINRRDFHKSLAAFAFSGLALNRATAATADVPAYADRIFLNRLTFGATPQSLQELQSLGREEWLNRQLDAPAKDTGLSGRFATAELRIEYEAGQSDNGQTWEALAENRPLNTLDSSPEDLVKLLDWEQPISYEERARPFYEVVAASYIRAVHAPAQLREVMTQFWHNHFNVYGDKDETVSALFPPYDAGLRENALGNFRTLLGHVAKSPPMLHYLNNDNSAASPANENYARELLELHTLGQENYFNDRYENWHQVPGAEDGQAEGYIDADVYEVARALTGWSIGDGRYVDDNLNTPKTGRFAYVENWHDPYQKRILGHEFPAFSGPMEDGEKLLDILAAHPGTAHFVTGKILRALGMETPSDSLHRAAVESFLKNREADDQIAQLVRTIATHPEFEAAPPTKLRRPFELLAAFFRATGAQVSPRSDDISWLLAQSGWAQHRVRPPTGHSDKTEDWANTRMINGVVSLLQSAHDENIGLTDHPLNDAPEGARTYGALAEYWANRFLVPQEAMAPALALMELDPADELTEDSGDLEWINTILATNAALGPEFLFR